VERGRVSTLLAAALASKYRDNVEEGSSSGSEGASRYWNMVKKRLAWAMEEHSLLGGQCQLLAGFVPAQSSQPSVVLLYVPELTLSVQ
jgi:hypothetical protein